MTNQRERSRLQEDLLKLYLRLNGFFVTGFIVHSSEFGRNRAEIDVLAVRHPYHQEPERLIRPYLEPLSGCTDLLICEVKSRGQRLQFNHALRSSSQVLTSVLGWSGLFPEDTLPDIVCKLQPLLQNPGQAFPCVETNGARICPVLCSPERWERRSNQPWFIPGSEMFRFMYDCFCPKIPRLSCSTSYDFSAWGLVYEPIVRFFKECNRESRIKELYQYIGI